MPHPSRLFVLTAIAALPSSWVSAQENKELDTVVVSASRIEQNTLEAPASVSVIRRDKLEASGAVRVGDVLTAQVPSLYMRGGLGTSSRINTAPIVSLRGPGGVKMLVDGISLSDGNAGSLGSLMGIKLSEIAQIEIVPGSSSALYGSDAVGGVVNIITQVPTKKETKVKYQRGFADGERNAYEASYRNRWENGFAASFSLAYEDMAGFARNNLVVLPVNGNGSGVNAVQGGTPTTTVRGEPAYIVGNRGATPSHAAYINGKFFYQLNAKSRFFAGFSRTRSRIGYEDFNSYLTRNGAPLNWPANNVSIDKQRLGTVNQTSFWDTSNPNLREETRYFAGYDGKLGKEMDLKLNVGYFNRKGYYVASGAGATFRGGPGTSTNTPNTTLDVSSQLGFSVGQKHYVIVGISSNRGTLDRKVYSLSNWRSPDDSRTGVLNEESSGHSMNNALFLQDQIFLSDALTLYLGGRYDHWTTSGAAKKYVGTPIGSVDSPEHSESAFSPKLAAVYRWTENLTLRSSIGTAFRAPTNFELYATPNKSGTRLLIADPNVKPETSTSWDIGIEKALPGKGSFKAAYYRTRMKDMIYRKLSPYTGHLPGIDTCATTTNAGQARVQGFELSGELPLNHWLRATLSYSYTDTKITRDDSGGRLEGKQLRYVPKNLASLILDAHRSQWRAYLSTTYSGLQYSTEDNSDSVKGVYGGTSKYWLSNLRVSYQFDPSLQASVGVNNLFNKEYYEFYRMPGRNAYVELSATF